MKTKDYSRQSFSFSYLLEDTPLGSLGLFFTGNGLAAMTYPGEEAAAVSASLPAPAAAWVETVKQEFARYFAGITTAFASLALDPQGTPFQLRVWQELRKIPWGATISYKELAARVGSPQGFQAVGQANGANPLPIIIPCHRVINANGALGGYSSGIERKRWLLRHEKAI